VKRPASATANPDVVAALHRVGRSWRCVAARRRNGGLELIDSREIRVDQESRLEVWLNEHAVGRTICVLPASSVICRTAPLPNAPEDQLMPALRLQAESFLLGGTPDHRRAMAILHAAPGESSRAGIVVAWPENTAAPRPPVTHDVTYAPDVACLAAMLNGYRSPEPIVWVDRSNGSVALAVTHAHGAVFRATREAGDDAQIWKQGVGRVLAETALSVGHTGGFTEEIVQSTTARMNGVAADDGALVMPLEVG
jgi:hypothetical protein